MPVSNPSGLVGPQGLSVLTGSGAPAGGLGVIDQAYIDTTSWAGYVKTGSSTWSSATPLVGAAGAAGAAGPAFASWRRDVCPFIGYTNIQGTWAGAAASGAVCGQLSNSSKALNDALLFDVGLEAGTWTLSVLTATFTDRGIATASIDGVTVGTMDMYSAGATTNVLKTIASIVIGSSGHHTLTFTAASKNASASAYTMTFEWITLVRTA